MPTMLKAMAFDVDAATLASLEAGLPGWWIEVVEGATAASLNEGWNPGAIDFLIVTAGEDDKATLALCSFLVRARALLPVGAAECDDSLELRERRRETTPMDQAPLLVLVSAGRAEFVRAILKTGAASCLVLPIDAKEVTSMLARVRFGNQPGRHTLDLDHAQVEDRWRDDGGQG